MQNIADCINWINAEGINPSTANVAITHRNSGHIVFGDSIYEAITLAQARGWMHVIVEVRGIGRSRFCTLA